MSIFSFTERGLSKLDIITADLVEVLELLLPFWVGGASAAVFIEQGGDLHGRQGYDVVCGHEPGKMAGVGHGSCQNSQYEVVGGVLQEAGGDSLIVVLDQRGSPLFAFGFSGDQRAASRL